MANGSRHSMRYVAEATYGTTPATPAFKPIRHTSTTLGLSKESLQSEEIRDDRQIADFRHGAYQVGGDMNIELSFASFDDLLAPVLLSLDTFADYLDPAERNPNNRWYMEGMRDFFAANAANLEFEIEFNQIREDHLIQPETEFLPQPSRAYRGLWRVNPLARPSGDNPWPAP